jgi:hypothetical protein
MELIIARMRYPSTGLLTSRNVVKRVGDAVDLGKELVSVLVYKVGDAGRLEIRHSSSMTDMTHPRYPLPLDPGD